MKKTPVCMILIAAVWSSGAYSQDVTVRTRDGTVSGVVAGNVTSFRGIPYAASPVGPLRWRPPQPVRHWQGVRPAKAYGRDCMQKPFPGDAAPLGTDLSEDCLFLNVWRPAGGGRKLPVIVWIYGGGFVNGGASPDVYAGDAFARQGVILVSFNYRLGRFGFFGFPALTRERPGEPKGNYAYMDQIAALKWVRRNIAAFGGDPKNVTVMGESAGGASVHMLMTSPMAAGLFTKAIIQSGGGRALMGRSRLLSEDRPELPSAETVGVNFARSKGIEGSDDAALARLRALDASAIVDGLNMATMMRPGVITYSGPLIDGRIVTEPTEQSYREGRFRKVPVMLGATGADLGFVAARSKDALFAQFGADADAARTAYDPDGTLPLHEITALVGADRTMVEPVRFIARQVSNAGAPAYAFRFSYVAETMRRQWRTGAPHATEIPFVFDTVAAQYGNKLSPADAAMAKTTNNYWVNFARSGNPNDASLPEWPRFDANGDQVLELGYDGKVTAGPDPWKKRLDVTAAAATVRDAAD